MTSATLVRLGCFFGLLASIGLWEVLAPRRRLTVAKGRRWRANLGIILLDVLLVRLLAPAGALGVAAAAQRAGWGVLGLLDLPAAGAVLLAILLLDLTIYLQHLMFHAVPLLWRLHMVHHADLDIDVTTGLRFHPAEIILSLLVKYTVIAALGPPLAAVFLFEILLNGTAMFNHGNIAIPPAADRMMRLLVVTPDMHRVHHSVTIRETNSNFGFNFPWWDRLFGTYRAQPVAGHTLMRIGLAQFRRHIPLLRLLALPVTGDPGRYSLDHIGRDPAVLARARRGP